MSDLIESSVKAKEAISKGMDYVLDMARHSASTNCALVSQNCKLINLLLQKDKEIAELRVKLAKSQSNGTLTYSMVDKIKALPNVIAVFSSVEIGEDFNSHSEIYLFVKEFSDIDYNLVLSLESEIGITLRVRASQGRDPSSLTFLKEL